MTIPPFCMPGPRRPQPPPRLPEPLQWPIPLLLEKFAEYRDQLVQEVVDRLPAFPYVKPEGGIPEADMDAAVQRALALARTSVQDVSGKADLVGGRVPAAQLPSYVDDVLEYASLANFPATGEEGKLYVAKDTNRTYRWSGTQYTEVSPSPAPVAPSTDPTAAGKPADAKATGDALAARPTKSQLDAGWWSEWEYTGLPAGWTVDSVDFLSNLNLWVVIVDSGRDVYEIGISGSADDTELSFTNYYDDVPTTVTATRHRVSAPVPTKPSDIGAQAALTFDTTPMAESTNPVTSGGIKTALDAKAIASKCKYEFNTATVTLSTTTDTNDTAAVTGILDHAKNAATLASTVADATITIPARTDGYTGDLFISLTVEGAAPSITFTDAATSDDLDIIFGEAQLADIDTGRNLILFSEVESGKWKVAVEHEDFPEVTP